jgi:lipid A disaccharide synthetase
MIAFVAYESLVQTDAAFLNSETMFLKCPLGEMPEVIIERTYPLIYAIQERFANVNISILQLLD